METPTQKKMDIRDTLEWLVAHCPWGRSSGVEELDDEAKTAIPNLRQGLDWLLGQGGEEEPGASETDAARHERRIELLLWILNLEKRLPPYGDEQPA